MPGGLGNAIAEGADVGGLLRDLVQHYPLVLVDTPSLAHPDASRLAWFRRCQAGHKLDVACLKLGRARILHMPGELFVEYQLAAKAMRRALHDAGLSPADIDWISAHATATELNDKFETAAIKSVFGEQAYRVPVSGTKAMTGHMMAATGALEAIFGIKAIETGWIPPTVNYETPDPECDLDYVPNQARQVTVNTFMTNAFGFGGHNAVLIFKRYSD